MKEIHSSAKKRIYTGSIFAQKGESELFEKSHWKRRLVIKLYPYALLFLDLFLITGIFGLLVMLRYEQGVVDALSRRILLVIVLPSIIGVYLIGGYNYATSKKRYRFISEHVIASAVAGIGVSFLAYTIVSYGVTMYSSRFIVGGTLVLFPLVSIAYRGILSSIQSYFERGNAICMIGAEERAVDLYHRLQAKKMPHNFIVVGCKPEQVGNHLIEGDPTSPMIEAPETINFNSSIDGKYVESYVVTTDMESLPADFSKRMIAALFSGHNFYAYEAYLAHVLRIDPPSQLTVNWPLLDGFRLTRSVSYDRFKRLCDIAAALVGFVLVLPILLATALAVKLTSKGPVLFKQERVGLREKPFMILKFRSMRVGSEKGDKYTAQNDERFTPIGKFIRKVRLDELPQLWNVLVGDLSLIGPRAEWVELVKGYEERLPFYHFRHAVKPGITGWAQVNYSYGANDEDTLEKLNYDLYYVRRYSLTLDVAIVVKTLYMMLFGKGT